MFTEMVAESLRRSLGVGYFILAYGLMGAVPAGLLLHFVFGRRRRYSNRIGLLGGFILAILNSLCWIVVPYCSAYPNLPGGIIGTALFGSGTWGQEISVHLMNLILWPLLGLWLSSNSGREDQGGSA